MSIHEDYIRAGADIVTANTFASARHLLERAGIGERTAELQRLAVRLAREAVARTADEAGRPVAVAGSLSTMRPVAKGTDQRDRTVELASIPWAANLREAAELQAEAGVDLLLLEMICDLEHGGMAVEAARATGLPVWVGLSAERRGPGPLMSFRDGGPPFADLIQHYAAQPIDALGVMHTSLPEIEEALPPLLAQAPMPVMAYPEIGLLQGARLAVRRGRAGGVRRRRHRLGRAGRADRRRLLRPRPRAHRGPHSPPALTATSSHLPQSRQS